MICFNCHRVGTPWLLVLCWAGRGPVLTLWRPWCWMLVWTCMLGAPCSVSGLAPSTPGGRMSLVGGPDSCPSTFRIHLTLGQVSGSCPDWTQNRIQRHKLQTGTFFPGEWRIDGAEVFYQVRSSQRPWSVARVGRVIIKVLREDGCPDPQKTLLCSRRLHQKQYFKD